jgi:uncharacterized protein YcbK (DUF882 family)
MGFKKIEKENINNMNKNYISEHFTHKELADPTTGEVKLQDGFIEDLELLRQAYGEPMIINSGCRSQAHNAWLKQRGYPASDNSFHLIGNKKYGTDCCAVDVAMPTPALRHRLIRLATDMNWTVGLAKRFIHLDRRARYTNLPPIVYFY